MQRGKNVNTLSVVGLFHDSIRPFDVTIIGAEALEQAICQSDKVEERLSSGVQDGTDGNQPGEQRTQQFRRIS